MVNAIEGRWGGLTLEITGEGIYSFDWSNRGATSHQAFLIFPVSLKPIKCLRVFMVSEVKSTRWDESLQHFVFLIITRGLKP